MDHELHGCVHDLAVELDFAITIKSDRYAVSAPPVCAILEEHAHGRTRIAEALASTNGPVVKGDAEVTLATTWCWMNVLRYA